MGSELDTKAMSKWKDNASYAASDCGDIGVKEMLAFLRVLLTAERMSLFLRRQTKLPRV